MIKQGMTFLVLGSLILGLLGQVNANEKKSEASSRETVMIYMIGSDLEASAGSATNDLQEMAESGIDLSSCNVVVYTGGSKKWHDDYGISESENQILELRKDGFHEVQNYELSSMGEADSLSRFLTYAEANYPSDTYDLILWDHGNGPLMGYGADKLYQGDALTLSEIQEALSDSPFGPEKKLGFIGFDACLMSSAELVCTVDEYAEYLIASQEVEPGFGWDYSFLSECGRLSSRKLSEHIAETYLSYCEAYYREKEKYRSDVTLSVMDLSRSDAFSEAMNRLFSDAGEDVSKTYSELAFARVNTRALGRATTGSEYDLVDLQSLLSEMQEEYPDETEALSQVLSKMVIRNETNAEGLCGLSLYYPYYNKKYYEKSWSGIYRDMNTFPDYVNYLQRYSGIWLGDEYSENFTEVAEPEQKNGSYTLQLTSEQQVCFASAGYYILMHKTGDDYALTYASHDVKNENGLLTAGFDGKVIYCTDGYCDGFTTVTKERDHDEKTGYYSAYGTLSNGDIFSDDYESRMVEFQFAVNYETEAVELKGIYDYQTPEEEALSTGKREELSLTDFRQLTIPALTGRYLTRDENGKITDYFTWESDGWYTATEVYAKDPVKFTYEPLYQDGHDYYLMFFVNDVQNHTYFSEMQPITLSKRPSNKQSVEEGTVTEIGAGESEAVIYEKDGITVSFELRRNPDTGAREYALQVENENEFQSYLLYDDILLNGKISCGRDYDFIDGGETEINTLQKVTDSVRYAGLTVPESISFRLTVNDHTNGKTLDYRIPVTVKLSKEAEFQTYEKEAFTW